MHIQLFENRTLFKRKHNMLLGEKSRAICTTLTVSSQCGTILEGYLPLKAAYSVIDTINRKKRETCIPIDNGYVERFVGPFRLALTNWVNEESICMDNQPVDIPIKQQVSLEKPDNHSVFLPDEHWAMWKWFALRGAGFPISQVLQLAAPACATAADLFLLHEAETEQLQQQTLALISAEASTVRGEAWLRLLKLLRKIKEGKQPPAMPFPLSAEVQESMNALQAVAHKKQQAYTELQVQFSKATEQTMHALREVAQDVRFREAVMWQNRGAVRNGIEPFLHGPAGSRSGRDQREKGQLIAKYLQRYCTKNDTIGFFGPLGWGRWVTDGEACAVFPGKQLLATRHVFFETWAIDALGEELAQNRALLPWAIPRLMPFLFLSGTTLSMPFARPLQLSNEAAIVLAACDGRRTAREVARTVLAVPCPGLTSEADVFALLDQLRQTRRISWTFDVSMEEWHPQSALRRQLAQITPESLRQDALRPLDQLEDARKAIAEAAGNVEQLNRALEHLEATFTELTKKRATREAGKVYAARTLVYEDCQRDIELTLGPALLQELGRPLALLLTSARWFTHAAAQFYLQAFREVYGKLTQKSGSSSVDFATFWSWVQPLLPLGPGQRPIGALETEFQNRWAALLEIPPGQRRVHYTSQHLQQRVQETFYAPCAGWRSACQHSPDVMISATDPEAILRGEYQLVLGELHQSLNTLDTMLMASLHPTPSDLLQAMATDMPESRVVPIFPRHVMPVKRSHPAFTLPKDWRLIFSVDSGNVPPGRALPIGQLVLQEKEGKLVVCTRDGQAQFHLLELFDGILSFQICDAFKILAPAPHTPRVTIDRLVVCRETWRFTAAELAWAFHPDLLECFVGMRRWARIYEMPRFLFVRVPNERKPYYIDRDSLASTEIFTKAIRQASEADAKDAFIIVTEMLPDPEHSWLADIDGNRYTCELRVVAVDQLKFSSDYVRSKV